MQWNPAQYLKFGAARIRPAIDLLQKSASLFSNPESVKNVLDLGCGPGNVIPYIAQYFPNATLEGVDSSNEMIEKGNKATAATDFASRIIFRVNTIEAEVESSTKPYDLLYSNAALHWCTNHEELFPKMLKKLVKPNGGVFAIQMPDTKDQPSHVLMEVAARNCGFAEDIANCRIPRAEHIADKYYEILAPFCTELEIWSSEYAQALPTNTSITANGKAAYHPVLEFTKSTGLMPILQALGGEESAKCQRFLEEYNRLLTEAYPFLHVAGTKLHRDSDTKDVTLLKFRRLFLVGKL